TIAHRFGYVGVLAVEIFVLPDGALLGDGVAPRVHNSGHWTLDGASGSQFEQHIRAVAGWPLAKARPHGPGRLLTALGHAADGYGSRRAPLRQDRGAPGPQDGARDAPVSRLRARARKPMDFHRPFW